MREEDRRGESRRERRFVGVAVEMDEVLFEEARMCIIKEEASWRESVYSW